MTYITVPNFSQMSLQTIFDRAVKHIGSTKKKSYNVNRCCYSGSGCNAAPFLSEDGIQIADTLDDGSSAGWDMLAEEGYVPGTHSEFMAELQAAHDSSDNAPAKFRKSYAKNMRELAENFSLNTKELDKLGW